MNTATQVNQITPTRRKRETQKARRLRMRIIGTEFMMRYAQKYPNGTGMDMWNAAEEYIKKVEAAEEANLVQ